MKNKKQVLLMGMIVCFVVIPMTVLAQPSRIIGGPLDEHANAIVRAINPMDGYVLAGWTMRPIAATPNVTKDALVLRVDQNGVPVPGIAKIFGGNQDEEATSMIRTSDNWYVVTGWTRSYNIGNTYADIFVVKFNADLSVRWGRVYHMTSNDLGHRAYSINEVFGANGATDGYILTGYLLCPPVPTAPPPATCRILVLRLDLNGNVTWVRTYAVGNNLNNAGFSITQVWDNSVPAPVPNVKFAVVGRTALTLTGQGDAFMMRLDSNGSVVPPALVFQGNYEDYAWSTAWDGFGQAPGIMVAGVTKSISTTTATPANIWVARIRPADASVSWSNVYKWDLAIPANGPDRADYIQGDKALIVIPGNAVNPSEFILCGITYSRGPNIPNFPNIMLMRLNPNGSVGWNENATVFPMIQPTANNFDIANGIVQTSAIPGNGFAVAGWTNSIFNPNPPPPSQPNLAGHNILFTTFTPSGTQSGNCDSPFKIKASSLNLWKHQHFDHPTNHMRTQDINVSSCSMNSLAICQ